MQSTIKGKRWVGKNKIGARHDTVLVPYQKIFNRKKIPQNEQYFTLAGSVSDGNGNINTDSEAIYMVNQGVVNPTQFQGVDIDESTISENKRLLPNYNWHNEDLYTHILKRYYANDFNPAIINVDHHKMIWNAGLDFFPICSILSCLKKSKILLIFNIMTKVPYSNKECSREEVSKALWADKRYRKFRETFEAFPLDYRYEGTGQGRKEFLSLIYYKK